MNSFLKSLGRLTKSRPELKEDISVHFVGVDLDGKAEDSIHDYSLQGVVNLMGYLNHKQALNQIFKSDLLLYPVATWASEDFIPGKTFEYLASGRPVLAIGPEVEGVEILKKANCVEIANHDNIASIEQAILKYYYLFKQKSLKKRQETGFLKYERKYLTTKLVEILNNMVDKCMFTI